MTQKKKIEVSPELQVLADALIPAVENVKDTSGLMAKITLREPEQMEELEKWLVEAYEKYAEPLMTCYNNTPPEVWESLRKFRVLSRDEFLIALERLQRALRAFLHNKPKSIRFCKVN